MSDLSTLGSIGRVFFGIAFLGLGVEHFVFQEFVTGRAPAWPQGIPGKTLWVYATGVLVMLAGVAIMARRWGRQAMLLVAIVVFVWALMRHLPIVFTDALLAGSWTQAGKALSLVGGSLAVAGTLPVLHASESKGIWHYANSTYVFARIGGICLGCFLIVGGLQHFKFTKFVVALIPSWVPGDPRWWVQFAGAALIAGGLGLLITQTAKIAGLLCGVMLFMWFWIVHVPRAFVSTSDSIAVFEALAFSGIALVVAGSIDKKDAANAAPRSTGLAS